MEEVNFYNKKEHLENTNHSEFSEPVNCHVVIQFDQFFTSTLYHRLLKELWHNVSLQLNYCTHT